MRNRVFNLVWGLSLGILGIVLLGNSLNLWFIDIFFNGWWTLFIIVPALICVCINKHNLFNLVLLLAGVFIFNLYRNSWSFKIIIEILFSLVVLIVGGNLINLAFGKTKNCLEEGSKYDNIVFNGFFGSFNEILNKRDLGSIKVSMFFSKLNLDINSSSLRKDVRIKVMNIFGFIKITGADNVNVEVSGSNIGSLIKNEIKVHNSKLPTVYIESVSIFGGIKVQK